MMFAKLQVPFLLLTNVFLKFTIRAQSILVLFINTLAGKPMFRLKLFRKPKLFSNYPELMLSLNLIIFLIYNGKLYSSYIMTTAMVSIVWAPFSDFMQTPTGRNESDKRFPRFTFQYTQSLPNVLENDFTFGKIDFKTEYEKKYLNGQKTSLLLQGGYAMGDVPITHLYNTMPNNLNQRNRYTAYYFCRKKQF